MQHVGEDHAIVMYHLNAYQRLFPCHYILVALASLAVRAVEYVGLEILVDCFILRFPEIREAMIEEQQHIEKLPFYVWQMYAKFVIEPVFKVRDMVLTSCYRGISYLHRELFQEAHIVSGPALLW